MQLQSLSGKVDRRVDAVVLGAGCAGLSLAWRLHHDPALAGARIALVDPHLDQPLARTWCWWGDTVEPHLRAMTAASWQGLTVQPHRGATLHHTLRHGAYHCIRGEDYARWHRERLVGPGISLHRQTALALDPDAGRVRLDSGEVLAATWIFSSLPATEGAAPASPKAAAPVQQFVGLEIETDTPCFDPGAVTLMDFQLPQQDGVCFLYVLPFSDRRALLEYTTFRTTPVDQETLEQGLRRAMARPGPLATTRWRVLRREHGCLPMHPPAPHPVRGALIPIGLAAGLMKPSTGYAFDRIQRHGRSLTRDLAEGRWPGASHPAPGPRHPWYDTLFGRVLTRAPERMHRIFEHLFRHVAADEVLRFLAEKTTPIEEAGLFARLPWLPFAAAALRGA